MLDDMNGAAARTNFQPIWKKEMINLLNYTN